MTPGTKAKSVLAAAGIEVGQDFNSLTSSQWDALLKEAEAIHGTKYGKPIPFETTGNYVRKRYDLLQRRAAHS